VLHAELVAVAEAGLREDLAVARPNGAGRAKAVD
jgi:hypothetical protein